MNPAEAYQAFLDLKARWMVPCHWGTFKLTDEPIDEPPRELRRAVDAAGGSFELIKVMAIGERWEIPEKSQASFRQVASQSQASLEPVSNLPELTAACSELAETCPELVLNFREPP
jgi:hypothetical protein